jgi:RNA polymerase sigma factor (TIGR02999 family)
VFSITRVIKFSIAIMNGESAAPSVSQLMAAFRQGDQDAANRLVEMFYPQLRRIAAAQMRHEATGHSWHPTLLVNELYLELLKIKALQPAEGDEQQEKAAFFGLASLLMKRLLIQHTRPLRRRAVKVDVTEDCLVSNGLETMAAVEALLARLETIQPRLRRVVECKVFEGLTTQETAERLGCGTATVDRDWAFAKHWLQRELPAENA